MCNALDSRCASIDTMLGENIEEDCRRTHRGERQAHPRCENYFTGYLMYQCPASDALNRSGSNPANGVGRRRYPTSTLNPNWVALANVSSPPPNARNPTPLSDVGWLGSGTGAFNVWCRKLSPDPTYGRTQT